MLITKEINLNTKSKVLVKCDYNKNSCKGIIPKTYYEYLKQHNKSNLHKDCCNNPECMKEKRKESTLYKYGVENIAQISEIQEKREITCIEKYGSKTPLANKNIINKSKNTIKEKYNVTNISQVDKIKEHKSEKAIDKYGVKNIMQSEEIKEKVKETCRNKYGVDNAMQNNNIKNKVRESLYKNKTAPCSNQQEYLFNILGGEINYSVNNCSLDIAFPNEMVYVEYDGSGHDLSLKLGTFTLDEFNNKQIRRKYLLSSNGWKEIRIISSKDKLPSDQIILKMISEAKEYLNTGHSWIKFDIDNNKVICSQYEKDYDFGKLRKIKKEDLERVS